MISPYRRENGSSLFPCLTSILSGRTKPTAEEWATTTTSVKRMSYRLGSSLRSVERPSCAMSAQSFVSA